jgi:signal transduction histidine kinase
VKVGLKITILAILPILLTALIAFGVGLYQKGILENFFGHEIEAQAQNEARKIAQAVYLMCRSAQESVQKTVDTNLRVAGDILARAGKVSLGGESLRWEARNQFTGEVTDVFLPPMLVGGQWLGKNDDPALPSPVVDAVRDLVGGTATLFQRMNDAGDMLRVATNVEDSEGRRAIATYIPSVDPDGTANPVVEALLRGETFSGRAYVVNDWYLTAYRPIFDEGGRRVIGALYVGVKQENIESLRQGIMDMVVGKTGYVYVLGGKGEHQGRYIISQNGERDGENLWASQDSDGRPFIQSIIGKALSLPLYQREDNVPVAFERYPWKNPGEIEPRYKVVAIAYFAPWDWVIGAGYYESDLRESQERMVEALRDMGRWLGGSALVMMLLSIPAGYLTARSIRLRVDSILNSVTDVLIAVDARDRVLLLSQAAEEFLGIPLKKARFRPVQKVVGDPVLRRRLLAALEQKEGGARFDVELPGTGGAAGRILEGRTSLVRRQGGAAVGTIIIMHDVTSERRIDRMKSEFISTAAHELRTPLSSIIGYSELLLSQSGNLDEEERKSLDYINRKAWNLSKIVDELLDVSRIESGHALPLEKTSCDLNALLRQAVDTAGKLTGKHRFDLQVAEVPALLAVDVGKIEQVLENILGNAVKFSPQGGVIRVTGRDQADEYRITVEDEGIGMTQEQVGKVFDKFYRADTSNTAVEGTGLGMSIVRHIVDAHGGHVEIESQKGRGTRVVVGLPKTA